MKTLCTPLQTIGLMMVVAFASFALTGCETGQSGTKNVLGEYSATMAYPADAVTRAAEAVLRDELRLIDVTANSTTIDGKVKAKTAQNDSVTVAIESIGENVSEVKVRVGLGDESLSLTILDKIKARLK